MKFEWSQILSLDMLIVVLTFLCIDMFDTIGTVVGVAEKANMIDKDSKVESFDKIFLADAIATTAPREAQFSGMPSRLATPRSRLPIQVTSARASWSS